MTADPWEQIRHMTVDQLVTQTKLGGSCLSLNGFTTPERHPLVVIVAVGKPGNEAVVQYAQEFHEKLNARSAWAKVAVKCFSCGRTTLTTDLAAPCVHCGER